MVFKVEQGTSNDGYIPKIPFDMSIAAADHAMWEAINAFPTGTTMDEWEEWVECMARVVVHEFMLLRIALILRSDGIQAKSLVQECATYSFMPFLTS